LSQEQVPSLHIQHLPNRLRFTLQQKIARAAHLESIPGILKRLQIRAQATLASGIGSLDRFLGSLNVYKYGLRLHWIAELVPWNRFLGSLNVYKYGLRLGTLASGIGSLELIPRLHIMKNKDKDNFF
jgi:hypothetical protein